MLLYIYATSLSIAHADRQLPHAQRSFPGRIHGHDVAVLSPQLRSVRSENTADTSVGGCEGPVPLHDYNSVLLYKRAIRPRPVT